MFPIDRSLLPSLPTRRALIVVDPQNDFLSEDGALPINFPKDLPERIANLATSFRKSGGDIIWICSQFEKSRSALDEPILTSDRPSQLRTSDGSRGRRRHASPQVSEHPCECPEAFLTRESPKLPECVRPGSPGAEMHPVLHEAAGPKDFSVLKSYYSAFKSEQLLKYLRMRLVTELFICGCTTNTSVMATAIDAASHGYTIAIVDDCCGFRNMMRHRTATKQISNTTGCDVLSAEKVLASIRPRPRPLRRPGDRPATSPGGRRSSVRRTRGEDGSGASSTSDILPSFQNLSLSPGRAADTLDAEAPAEDPALPIQPVVNSTTIEGAREPQTTQQAPETDAVDLRSRQASSETDESQNNDATTRAIAQPPAADIKEPSTPAVQHDRGIAPQHDLQTKLYDKESKTTIPSTARLKSDEVLAGDEIGDPGLSLTKNDPGSRGPIVQEASESRTDTSHHEPTAAPSDMSKADSEGGAMAVADEGVKLKESEPLCEGDTAVVYDILPKPLSDNIFEKVKNEARWQRMMHQGGEVPRLAAIQGEVGQDGSMPVYRHPMDESPPLSPFSPTVLEIKKVVEKQLGHPLNHVLIQFYRDGGDYISEHSDKTIDVVKDSYIANVSLGAERTMMFRSKRQLKSRDAMGMVLASSPAPSKRRIQRIALPHNSLCKMGLKTNMRWLHSIRADRRPEFEKSDEQLAYDGGRISLTFRHIATFLDRESKLIWGQGATAKTREEAGRVINGEPSLSRGIVQKFSQENNTSDFDWNEAYGGGFDVLHITSAPRLFLSSDPVVNMRIQFMLADYGIDYARGSMSPLFSNVKKDENKSGKAIATGDKHDMAIPEDLAVKFADNDFPKTIVNGEMAIMLYLDRVYGQRSRDGQGNTSPPSRRDLAKELTRFQQALTLLGKYRAISDAKAFEPCLRVWEEYAAEGEEFIAGPTMTLADYAFWPVLNDVVRMPGRSEFGEEGDMDNLKRYYERVRSREAGRRVLLACASCIRKKPDTNVSTAASSPGPSSVAASAST
ncbi:hypothetical protein GGR52DRAFT_587140 [Hypoxylon sp. FL1284]|nr:hypothetical protein GGR52DRAFT_587140 [Hypoxylon sp. FL1284]